MGIDLRRAPKRRRATDDLSLTGRIVPPLWAAVGLNFTLAGIGGVDGGRVALVPAGVVCLVVAAGLSRFDWSQVPVALVRAVPHAGMALGFVLTVAAPAPTG